MRVRFVLPISLKSMSGAFPWEEVYFDIVNVSVFEMDRIPDGAWGSRVTKAVWIRVPTRAGIAGRWIAAFASPRASRSPEKPEKIPGSALLVLTRRRSSGLSPSFR